MSDRLSPMRHVEIDRRRRANIRAALAEMIGGAGAVECFLLHFHPDGGGESIVNFIGATQKVCRSGTYFELEDAPPIEAVGGWMCLEFWARRRPGAMKFYYLLIDPEGKVRFSLDSRSVEHPPDEINRAIEELGLPFRVWIA
jgi:hypothetical protein